MSTTIKKYKIQQLQENDDMLELHPETDADVVNYSNTIDGTAVSNVKAALDKVASGIGVTGVKGNAETDYRKGNVNITPANIGLGNVSNDAQVKGLPSGTTENDIVTWGANGYAVKDSGKSFTTEVRNSTNAVDTKIPTEKGVRTAIDSAMQNAIEVAEGKTKNYVIDDTYTETGVVNTSFASNPLYNYIEITISGNSIKTVGGIYVELSTLKVGDIISITNTSVPDRWVGNISNGKIQFYALEIKLNIDTNFTNPSNNPVSSSAVKTYVDDAISGVNTTIGNIKQVNVIEKDLSNGVSTSSTIFTSEELASIKAGTVIKDTSTNNEYTYCGKDSPIDFNDYNCTAHIFVNSSQLHFDTSKVYTLLVNISNMSTTVTAGIWKTTESVLYKKPTNGIPATDIAGWNFKTISASSGTFTTSEYNNITDKTWFTYNGTIYRSLNVSDSTYMYFIAVIYDDNSAEPIISRLKIKKSDRTFTIQNKFPYFKPTNGIPSSDLATSGVTAGTYSAVTVNNKGLVTAGAQMIEVGTANQTTPSASLAVGGLFFKQLS